MLDSTKGLKSKLVKAYAAEKKCSESTIWRAFRSGKMNFDVDYNNQFACNKSKAIRYNNLDFITVPNLAMLNELSAKKYMSHTNSRGITEVEYVNKSKSKRLYISFQNEMSNINWSWADTLIYGVLVSLFKRAKENGKLRGGKYTITIVDILRQLHLQDTDDNRKWIIAFLNKMMDINADFRMTICKLKNGDKKDETVFTKILQITYDRANDSITYAEPALSRVADFFGYIVSMPRNLFKVGRSTISTILVRSYILYRSVISKNEKNYMKNAITKQSIIDATHRDITDDFLRNYFRFLQSKNVIGGFAVSTKKVDYDFNVQEVQEVQEVEEVKEQVKTEGEDTMTNKNWKPRADVNNLTGKIATKLNATITPIEGKTCYDVAKHDLPVVKSTYKPFTLKNVIATLMAEVKEEEKREVVEAKEEIEAVEAVEAVEGNGMMIELGDDIEDIADIDDFKQQEADMGSKKILTIAEVRSDFFKALTKIIEEKKEKEVAESESEEKAEKAEKAEAPISAMLAKFRSRVAI